MNVFEVVKENVTARQAAEAYGLKVGRTGMACCPFHSDKSPSMKLDERYYCFGCGATGDAVDLTAKLFGIGLREAAVKLAEDFGLNYDSRQKPSVRPHIREPTPEQKYQKEENHCYKVLTDYFHLLREWEKKYAPRGLSAGIPDDAKDRGVSGRASTAWKQTEWETTIPADYAAYSKSTLKGAKPGSKPWLD